MFCKGRFEKLNELIEDKVFMCRDTVTNKVCTVKRTHKNVISQEHIDRWTGLVAHGPRYIQRVVDVVRGKAHDYLVTEYVEGRDLFAFIFENKTTPLSVKDVFQISQQILSAISHMHAMNLCHLDIKPENIVCNPDSLSVTLIDLDFMHDGPMVSTKLGTFGFIPPERMTRPVECPFDGMKADVWAVGIVLYELFTWGCNPFGLDADDYPTGFSRRVEKCAFADLAMNTDLPSDRVEYVGQMTKIFSKVFVPTPDERPTVDDLLLEILNIYGQ